jgi:hypothetical protein
MLCSAKASDGAIVCRELDVPLHIVVSPGDAEFGAAVATLR